MPAVRPAKVDHVRDDFISSVDQSIALVKAIKALPVKVRPSNTAGLHPKYADQVVSLAFMGIIASLEEFLERTAVRYLTGSKTDSGYKPTLKHGKADTIESIQKLQRFTASHVSITFSFGRLIAKVAPSIDYLFRRTSANT